jgi:hypothetical protein
VFLNQAESEARETQCWLETAVECGYIGKEVGQEFFNFGGKYLKYLRRDGTENSPNKSEITCLKLSIADSKAIRFCRGQTMYLRQKLLKACRGKPTVIQQCHRQIGDNGKQT